MSETMHSESEDVNAAKVEALRVLKETFAAKAALLAENVASIKSIM
jgi:hypothetical protein